MKRGLLIVFFITLIILTAGCEPKGRGFTNETLYDLYETSVMDVGEIKKLNVDYFDIDFNRVEFKLSDEEVARVNYKEELVTLSTGKTRIKAYLYNDEDMVKIIDYGVVYVVDINDPRFIPIRYASEFRAKLISNPSGFFYLENDIDFDQYDPIPYFEGVLINPYKHVITGLNINESGKRHIGLFNEINNAYIDGIILENISIEGRKESEHLQSIGGLAGRASNTYLRNIKVTGDIKRGFELGGIVGDGRNTIIIHSSFEGTIDHGKYVGGLIGYSYEDNGIMTEKNLAYISNSYVIADLSGGFKTDYEETANSWVGGLVGKMHSGGMIKSSYYSGSIDPNEGTPIANHYGFTLKDVYYTFYMEERAVLNNESRHVFELDNLQYIDVEQLKEGDPLKGLENFIFVEGDFPRNSSDFRAVYLK